MIVVSLSSPKDMKNKLNSILDTVKTKGEAAVVIMTDRKWHMEVFDYMLKHDKISRLKLGGNTFFIIKEMRIEIKPIDFYV